MKKELMQFIEENSLSPFHTYKTQLNSGKSIYKTRDAKSIHTRTLSKLSENFVFSDTSNLFNFFEFTTSEEVIKKRQTFFEQIKTLGSKENSFLKKLTIPRPCWTPNYDVVIVTENTETFTSLKEMNCPVELIISENDISRLESRDIVQFIDCGDYKMLLEILPQSLEINSLDEVYLERFLEKLSGWKNNLEILKENSLSESLRNLVNELSQLINLTGEEHSEILTREKVEESLEKINSEINQKIKDLTISGEALMNILSQGKLPENLQKTLEQAIEESKIPRSVLEISIPVKIDEQELEIYLQRQNSQQFTNTSEKIKSQSESLKQVPKKLEELKKELLFFDFVTGLSQTLRPEMIFPKTSNELKIESSKNIFLESPQPISFNLNQEYKCSILTGANSGGKTTLVEHIIQLISMTQVGLPVYGNVSLPPFSNIYYFAKNKGSISKGAFETLLTQMSGITENLEGETLILADEIEAVTEPGVAGNIIAATADFYIKRNCFLIIATHLGHEIQKTLPEKTRIDGIEAKGLDENFELIVNHNPVQGQLAHSTPELIVEKMANSKQKEYFIFLNEYLKNKKY